MHPYVKTTYVEFEWHPGFSVTQARRSIASLHEAARLNGYSPLLEISSKSPNPIGVQMSAFNLVLRYADHTVLVEAAFQGSKVFEFGGPYQDLYGVAGRDAKSDPRITQSGKLIGFRFFELDFPNQPVTAFYDWLYLTALLQHRELISKITKYRGFTDIAFNPHRSLNCQARSAALFVALSQTHDIVRLMSDIDSFLATLRGNLPC
jgi:hypothetical protein